MTARKAPEALSVYIMPEKLDNLPAPTSGPYYVIARTKAFIYRNFHFGRALVPIREITSIPPNDIEGMLWKDFPNKMPIELVGKAWSFFRAVYEKHRAEAMVDITWHPDKGYRLFVPLQETTFGSVNALREPEHYENRSITVGTMHSHCNFGAFHSGTDESDAADHDGIHLTLGEVDKTQPDIAAMISMSGVTWDIKLEEFFDAAAPTLVPHPEWWMNQIVRKIEPPKSVQKPSKVAALVGKAFSGSFNPPATTPSNLKNDHDRHKAAANKSLTPNKFILPAKWKQRIDLTLEEMAYTDGGLTSAQINRIEDALEHMSDIDIIMASMGLQISYTVIEGAPIQNQKILDDARREAEEKYYTDTLPFEDGPMRYRTW